MKDPWNRFFKMSAALYFIMGISVLAALLFSGPMMLGEGGLNTFVDFIEQTDFRPWLMLSFCLLWMLPMLFIALLFKFQPLGRRMVIRFLESFGQKTIPVTVQIKQQLPIELNEKLQIPLNFRTHMDIEKEANIRAEIPVRTELEIDTTVQTKVLGIGNIRIPIRTTVPIDLRIPISSKVQVEMRELPIVIDDKIDIQLPKLDVPIDTKFKTRVELLSVFEANE